MRTPPLLQKLTTSFHAKVAGNKGITLPGADENAFDPCLSNPSRDSNNSSVKSITLLHAQHHFVLKTTLFIILLEGRGE